MLIMADSGGNYYRNRQGESDFQWLKASVAQAVDLSA